ncbi:hypothetical protein AB3S75_000623 [Citrus x aurantiifolia]
MYQFSPQELPIHIGDDENIISHCYPRVFGAGSQINSVHVIISHQSQQREMQMSLHCATSSNIILRTF